MRVNLVRSEREKQEYDFDKLALDLAMKTAVMSDRAAEWNDVCKGCV